MTWATQVALINTDLLTVAGIGKVINYSSDLVRHENIVTELADAGILNGAMITRETYEERNSGGSGFRFIGKHGALITMIYTHKQDGSRQAPFDALLDEVAEQFRGNSTVMVKQPEDGSQAVVITPIGHKKFGNMLVHFAEVRFTVEEVFTITA